MAKPHGSVRIGPISLFTLIIILCLAVLATLSVTTARAELSITERQAATTTETYQLETMAQTFVADVDTALAQGDAAALSAVLAAYGVTETAPAADAPSTPSASEGAEVASAAEAGEAIADETPAGEAIADESLSGTVGDEATVAVIECPAADPVTASGTFDGTLISVTFSLESGRTLEAVLRVNDDATYRIEQWKTTTQWTDDGTGANLWLG
ncbi:hypothetical protein [uncultured Adlercreutzia sp.]|uniref:hypothetical protein n=1 Tax=uncultured Adlercreutzia sp. TaxID=875803 RepID=UPI00267676A3|nr:hypothetical protein [uncultured Adlercreutzia sp.]